MKKLLVTILILVAIIAGLSMIKISIVQNQRQEQSQITKQYNTQLTIIDTHRTITNISWKYKIFQKDKDFEDFMNNEMSLFQQLKLKFAVTDHAFYVCYPVINTTEEKTITNYSEQSQMTTNKIELNLLSKIKSLIGKNNE